MNIEKDIPGIIKAIVESESRVVGIKILDSRDYDEGLREVLVLIQGLQERENTWELNLKLNKAVRDILGATSPYVMTCIGTLGSFDQGKGGVIYGRI